MNILKEADKPKVLHLTINKKWFDMILSGEKKEEYRKLKKYWIQRLVKTVDWVTPGEQQFEYCSVPCELNQIVKYDIIHFYNGPAPSLKYPNFIIEFKGVDIGPAKPEWSDNWPGNVFRIKLGNIIK